MTRPESVKETLRVWKEEIASPLAALGLAATLG